MTFKCETLFTQNVVIFKSIGSTDLYTKHVKQINF